jgi:hypothetical protein
MIRQSNDGTGTEMSHWLRRQAKDLPSKDAIDCFTFHNLDYIELCWTGKTAGFWMAIEEKRHMAEISYSASQTFTFIDRACHCDPKFKGFHLLQFENTNPDDGKIFLDGVEISKEELIKFLRFECKSEVYKSYYKYSESSSEDLIKGRVKCKKVVVIPRSQSKLGEAVF